MEKQPPDITDALLTLNLFSFPLENVHCVLLMQDMFIAEFYHCTCLQQHNLS